MHDLLQKTKTTSEKLTSAGLRLVEKWEHEFRKEVEADKDMKMFMKNHEIQNRLNPRDAFFGGRTNAVKLFHVGNAKYVDFTSLYPWVSLLFYFTL